MGTDRLVFSSQSLHTQFLSRLPEASSAVLDGSGGVGAAPCLTENTSSSQRMMFDANFLKMSFI